MIIMVLQVNLLEFPVDMRTPKQRLESTLVCQDILARTIYVVCNNYWSDNSLDIATMPTKIEARIHELLEIKNRGNIAFDDLKTDLEQMQTKAVTIKIRSYSNKPFLGFALCINSFQLMLQKSINSGFVFGRIVAQSSHSDLV